MFTEDEKRNLIVKVLRPSVVRDIEDLLRDRRGNRICANGLEVMAKILVTISTGITFICPFLQPSLFSNCAPGLTNMSMMATFLLCNYYKHESSERSTQLNAILRYIGVPTLLDIETLDENMAPSKTD
jgi:hypothetical protein